MSVPEGVPDQRSALDLVVKYAVVLTWLVYAAGLTKISGFLGTLNVPMDPDFYAFPRVFSSGGFAILEIVIPAAIALFCMESSIERPKPFMLYVGWIAPIVYILATKRILWVESGPVRLRLQCALWVLVAVYLLIVLARRMEFARSSAEQVLVALVFLLFMTQASGSTGDLEAYTAMANAPNIQLLLPADDVAGASKLGLTFSTTSAPGLCDPVDVIAFTDKMYYVWLPIKLDAKGPSPSEVKLHWGPRRTIALPRDRVLIAAAAH